MLSVNEYGERMTITRKGKRIEVKHDDFADAVLKRVGNAAFLLFEDDEESMVILAPSEANEIKRYLATNNIKANDIEAATGIAKARFIKYVKERAIVLQWCTIILGE